MNVPNVMPNIPNALPQAPNVTPDAPFAMQSQQAGKVQLGCGKCGQMAGLSPSTWPVWAKVLVPTIALGLTTTIIVLAVRRARRMRF